MGGMTMTGATGSLVGNVLTGARPRGHMAETGPFARFLLLLSLAAVAAVLSPTGSLCRYEFRARTVTSRTCSTRGKMPFA
jgi:hypothetical protein